MHVIDDGSKSAGYLRGYIARQGEIDALQLRIRALERAIEQMCEHIGPLPGSRETVTSMMLAASVLPKVLEDE